MSKLFDIACNFTSERFDDLEQIIKRAKENNVYKFAIISSQKNDFNKIIDLRENFKNEFVFTLGIHPHNAKEFDEKLLKSLDGFIKKYNPNAVGETGLDFFRNLSSYEEQVFAFEEQIKLSIKYNKPLFLHQRDSHEIFLKIIKKYSSDICDGIVHCFTGTKQELDDYLNLNLNIGITGWICDEKRNTELRETIKNIPLDKLMIETDCPYLIPKNLIQKPKNNRNEPMYLNHIAEEVSKLMEVTKEELAERTYINSCNFFK